MPDPLPQVWAALNYEGDVVGISSLDVYNYEQAQQLHEGRRIVGMQRDEAWEKFYAYCEKQRSNREACHA